jgi:hypothetical protein
MKLTHEEFVYLFPRQPTCSCKARKKMTLEQDGNYHCYECGLVVSKLATNADIRKLSTTDKHRIIVCPASRKVG